MPILFSTGFESGTIPGDFSYTEINGAGTVTAVNAPVHSGAWAAKCINDIANNWAAVTKEFGTGYDELYCREYVYLPSIPTDEDVGFMVIRDEGHANVLWASIWKDPGTGKIYCNIENVAGVPEYYASLEVIVLENHWHLFEMYGKRDNVNGIARLWLDQALVINATGKDTDAGDLYDAIKVGNTGTTLGGVEIDIDDIAASDTGPIGPEPLATLTITNDMVFLT